MIPSPAVFNLSNALGAIACAEALGISADAIEVGLSRAYAPGRMELYPSESGRIMGVVDYAHNGMSLETLLRDLRASYPDREFAVVFGATGGKGVDRRETMGEAAGKLADRIVITEDEIDSLRRFKDDVKEVAQGYECGIGLDKFSDIKEGDIFEAFIMEEYRD